MVSSRSADIFAGNAIRNGLLAIEIPAPVNEALLSADGLDVVVDLPAGTLAGPQPGLAHAFETDPFARRCLLQGQDPIAFLLGKRVEIAGWLADGRVPCPNLCALVDGTS